MEPPQLDASRATFAAFDAAQPAPSDAPAAPPAPPVDHAAYARHGVDALCSIFIRADRPRLAAVWSDKRRADVAQALAPILAKYDDQIGPWLARWGDWIGVGLVVGPAVIDSIDAYRADDADASKPAAQPAPRSSTPTPPPESSPLAAFPLVQPGQE
jgi:hypothetical protein